MTVSSPIPGRIERVRTSLAAQSIPALLITQMDNVRWITGFTGSSGFALLTQTAAIFATDSRYVTQSAEECPDYELVKLETSMPEELEAMLERLEVKAVAFESPHVSVAQHELLRKKLPSSVELMPTERVVENLRMVKDDNEIESIQAACDLADRAFAHILPFIKSSVNEYDAMLELEWFIRSAGQAEIAFDTILVSGTRSALPHGKPTGKLLQDGDFVTLDFGAKLNMYCSDITRTVVLGKATDEQRKVYTIVLDAMNRALEGLTAGAMGKDVDAIARDYIALAGYGDYFGHGLGHSLGMEVHDGPGLSTKSEVVLAPGMVMTVEPGIYIPEWGGVRIEQDVVVTVDGPRVLTHSTTELLEL